MKIGIVGAGWYGCHIASTLKSIGVDATIYEKNSRVLHEASGNNQFRLHMGFHYARSYVTRLQSRDGYSRFLERYPGLSRDVASNLYAIPKYESSIDFLTYKLIMTAAGIEFNEVSPEIHGISAVSGVINCREKVILTDKARAHFNAKLKDALNLNSKIESIERSGRKIFINGTPFDYIIDTTWGHLVPSAFPVFYEPTLLFYYKCQNIHPAVTLVDGPLCSIYPTEDAGIYTLSSVPHTPLGQYCTAIEARSALNAVSTETISKKRLLMENQIQQYLPNFLDNFEYMTPQFSIKTKLHGHHDDRSCYVAHNNRIITVMSGKIDTIFFAAQRILSFLDNQDGVRNLEDDSQGGHLILS